MKKNLLFAAAAGIMLFSACSNDEDIINGGGANDVNVSGEITLALNAGGSGAEPRAARPVNSSEAYSEVTDVELKLFKRNGENWEAANGVTTDLAKGGWAISNWETQSAVSPGTTDNKTTKTVKLKNLDKSAEYKLVAYGYKKELKTTLVWTAALAVATPNAGEDVEEIFAGEKEFSTNDKGKISTTPVQVEMRREVAGVLGYFKNIPEKVGETTVKSVRVYASSSNTAYNIPSLSLQNQCGTAGTERVTVLNLAIPTEGVTVVEGIYNWAGKNETNLKTEANSLLGGCFLVPFAKVEGKATFTIALCDENGKDLKTWTGVLDQTQTGENDTKIFNVNRNYFYSFGKKLKANTTGGPDPQNPDPDEPIDLSVNTEITIILNNAWGVIHNMGIEEN